MTDAQDPAKRGSVADDGARIAAYLEGDEGAFEEVGGWIRREIEARYPSLRSEREDLCQAVHEKLLANLRGGRFGGRSAFRTYVVAITHHTAIDRLRRRHREAPLEAAGPWETPDAAPNPYETAARLERTQLLHRALHLSPKACRILWRMIFLERLSYAEIARRLGIPAGTVKSRVWHCRRKALAILARLEGGSSRGGSRPRR